LIGLHNKSRIYSARRLFSEDGMQQRFGGGQSQRSDICLHWQNCSSTTSSFAIAASLHRIKLLPLSLSLSLSLCVCLSLSLLISRSRSALALLSLLFLLTSIPNALIPKYVRIASVREHKEHFRVCLSDQRDERDRFVVRPINGEASGSQSDHIRLLSLPISTHLSRSFTRANMSRSSILRIL